MSLQDRHIYEKNVLAFKFGLIIQFFEILSTIVYGSGRVGWINSAAMMVLQVLAIVAFILVFVRFG